LQGKDIPSKLRIGAESGSGPEVVWKLEIGITPFEAAVEVRMFAGAVNPCGALTHPLLGPPPSLALSLGWSHVVSEGRVLRLTSRPNGVTGPITSGGVVEVVEVVCAGPTLNPEAV
jgi:hypothetical protein